MEVDERATPARPQSRTSKARAAPPAGSGRPGRENIGGAQDGGGQPQREGDTADAQLLAAALLPYNYYQSGAARARREVFVRRGLLTRELTALGLPPVYEHPRGVLVGRQVSTQPEEAGRAAPGRGPEGPRGRQQQQQQQPQGKQGKQQPAAAAAAAGPSWGKLRAAAALNPARNPVMARNIRLKAQLARGTAAAAKPPRPSGRLLRHLSALDEASRTIAKLQVVAPGGGTRRRLGSAPLSKPYYPRRRRGGVPVNESEGGDRMPGKLARRAAEQAAEEAEAEERAARRRGCSEAERRRRARIEELADVIVAAPQLGIHELGAYLPHELAAAADGSAAAAAPSSAGLYDSSRRQISQQPQGPRRLGGGRVGGAGAGQAYYDNTSTTAAATSSGTACSTALVTAELAEALRELKLCAAAGRAAVAAAEDDYGSHFIVAAAARGGGGGGGAATPALSPIASSYGSGGHYLYEEGMAEDEDAEESDGSDGDGGSSGGGSDSEYGSRTAAAAAAAPAGSRYPDKVTVETDPRVDLVVVRYPAGSAISRRRAQARSADGGAAEARRRSEQIAAWTAAAATPVDLEAMRRPDAQPGNEVTGGRRRHQPTGTDPAAREPSSQTAPDAAPAAADTAAELSPSPSAAAAVAAADAGAAATGAAAPPPSAMNAVTPAAARATVAAAAMLHLPNEVSYPGRVRILQQPEIAGKDLSGVWAEGAIATARPGGAAGGGRARATRDSATAAGAPPPPSGRRDSHSERNDALLAAGAAAAAAAAEVEVEATGGSAQGQGGGAGAAEAPAGQGSPVRGPSGGRQRTAARSGRPAAAPTVTVARRVATPDSGGGDRQAAAPSRWGDAHIGRAVAVAVAVPAVAAASADTPTAAAPTAAPPAGASTAAAPATLGAANTDALASATAASQVFMPDTQAEAAPAAELAAAGTAAAAAAGRPVGVAPIWAGAGRGGDGGDGDGDGPSLDRFGMLSDADSDEDDADADEDVVEERDEAQDRKGTQQAQHLLQGREALETVASGERRGAAPRRHGRGGRGRRRGPAAAAAVESDPWDSSSDEDNPWGVEDADGMGYPLQPLGGGGGSATAGAAAATAAAMRTTTTIIAGAAAVVPNELAAAAAALPPSPAPPAAAATAPAAAAAARGPTQAVVQTAVGSVRRGGGSSGGSSTGSWGVDRHPAPAPAEATAAAGTQLRASGAAGALTAQALRRLASAAARANPAAPAGAAAAASGAGVSLRQMFGLAGREQVVDPRDIPPLPLTPPPVWLVKPREAEQRAQSGQAASSADDAKGSGPDGQLHSGRQRPSGRVEAALLRAEARPPARTVRHDSRTFYFSEHPGFLA